jgi:hypothetical protein
MPSAMAILELKAWREYLGVHSQLQATSQNYKAGSSYLAGLSIAYVPTYLEFNADRSVKALDIEIGNLASESVTTAGKRAYRLARLSP